MSAALAFPDADPTASLDSHRTVALQRPRAVEVLNSPPTIRLSSSNVAALAGDQTPDPATVRPASNAHPPGQGSTPPAPTKEGSIPNEPALVLADPLLALAADVLNDLESVRIANENRLRQLTRAEEDSDGEERGFGLTLDHPDVRLLAALVDDLANAEHRATLNLARAMRKHPLGPWVKAQRGIGDKQGARLLASIGDPYWNTLHDRPRTVSELWAYAGYHVLSAGHIPVNAQSGGASGGPTGGNPDHRGWDTHSTSVGVAAFRARGQKANWSAAAKMRAHLVAVSCMKTTGPYRDVYEQGREKYADTVHPAECKRCGPAGKPALAGSPRSAGHQHAMALRLVAKTVLKEMWREAKRLHEEAL